MIFSDTLFKGPFPRGNGPSAVAGTTVQAPPPSLPQDAADGHGLAGTVVRMRPWQEPLLSANCPP